ncbi:MAG: hypothetical protein WD181_02595 [Solirubrobacterales bacterium]
MILGEIQISECVTRLRVSEVSGVGSRRVLDRSSWISADIRNCERLSALLTAEIKAAREAGAVRVEVAAARALRGTRLLRLLDRVARTAGTDGVHIPPAADTLAAGFLAVTRPRVTELDGPVAVALIGDEATGLAVGTPGHPPEWVGSRPLGAATLTDRARFTDPPLPNQIEAAVNGAMRAIGSLALPESERIFLTTPMWATLERLCGSTIQAAAARRGLDSILGQTEQDIAAWFGAESGRARLLPATVVLTFALAELTGSAVEPCPVDPVAGRFWLAESRHFPPAAMRVV